MDYETKNISIALTKIGMSKQLSKLLKCATSIAKSKHLIFQAKSYTMRSKGMKFSKVIGK